MNAPKRAPWCPTSWYGKFAAFVLAPVLDPHDNYPSAPRCMAWAILLATETGHPVPAIIAGLLLATMFGYSMFKAALEKSTFAATSADSVVAKLEHTTQRVEHVDEKTEHTIIETRGPTGEPLRSNPPVPAARTPSGDD